MLIGIGPPPRGLATVADAAQSSRLPTNVEVSSTVVDVMVTYTVLTELLGPVEVAVVGLGVRGGTESVIGPVDAAMLVTYAPVVNITLFASNSLRTELTMLIALAASTGTVSHASILPVQSAAKVCVDAMSVADGSHPSNVLHELVHDVPTQWVEHSDVVIVSHSSGSSGSSGLLGSMKPSMVCSQWLVI